jgi:hypothetical protein
MTYWTSNHDVEELDIDIEEAKLKLKNHFANFCSPDSMKALAKIFKF